MKTISQWASASFLLCFSALIWALDTRDSTDWVEDNVFTQGIEGPAVDAAGNLFAVNYQKQGTIGKIDPQGKVSLFVTLPEGSIGNGIRISAKGDMFVADYKGHNIWRIDPSTRRVTEFASNQSMHQPNDITLLNNGVLFASDPNWTESSGQLWRIDTDGSSTLVEANMSTTNGVEVSPDQQRLYVNESVSRKIWVYDLDENNQLTNKRLFTQFDDFGLDGMRADCKGNLYVARYGKGVVAKLSPEGELLSEYTLAGKFPTNVAFGGADGTKLYVTMQQRGAIEVIDVKHPGASFCLVRRGVSQC